MADASTARLLPLFGTPVATQIVSDHADLSRSLSEAILRHREAEQGVSISNIGGWQSRNDMGTWGRDAVRRLASSTIAMAEWMTVDAAPAPGRRIEWTPEIWANVNGRGDSNQRHWHPGSYLSAVYYVETGYAGSEDRSLGGELVFVDPRMPYLRMRTPDLFQRGADGTPDATETWVRPQDGLLIMFPSYVAHSVRPYLGEGRRISIAINLVARVRSMA